MQGEQGREAAVEGTRHLSRSLWLRGLLGNISPRPEIDVLAARMREVLIAKGERLYRRGGAADDIGFIVSGTIRQGDREGLRFRSGDVLGFIDAMQGRAHRHDAVALEDTVVLLLSVEDWLEFLEDNFDFLQKMMLTRVTRLPLRTYDGEETSKLLRLSGEELLEPKEKRRSALYVRMLLALHACLLFRNASIQAVAQLARSARTIAVSEQTPLRRWAKGIFVVIEGQVQFQARRGEVELDEIAGPSELLGSVVPLGEALEEFVVIGRPRGRVLFIDQELFFDVMEDHFDLALSVLSFIAVQIEERNVQDESSTQSAHSDALLVAPPKRDERE